MTEWRDIAGYEGYYQVSNDGQVKSLARTVVAVDGTRRRYSKERILSQRIRRRYLALTLAKDNQTTDVSVHRLVAETFLRDSYFEGAVVCHNDGNAMNNHAENLRWDTQSSNIIDAVRQRTHYAASKTQCKRGHDYSPENTHLRLTQGRGGRRCVTRVCKQCFEIWRADKRRRYREVGPTAEQRARHNARGRQRRAELKASS